MSHFERVLIAIQKRHNLQLSLGWGLLCFFWALVGFGLYASFGGWGWVTPPVDYALSLLVKTGIVFTLLVAVTRCRRRWMSRRQAARFVDEGRNDPRDVFLNALELKDQPGPLVQRALAIADREATELKIAVRHPLLVAIWPRTLALIVLTVLFGCLLPDRFQSAGKGLAQLTPPRTIHKTALEIRPGSLSMVRGRSLTVESVHPEPGAEHRLFCRSGKVWREYPMPDARKVFPHVDDTFDYYVKTPWAVSDTFRVTVFDEPAVKRITLRYEYPAYTGLKPTLEENSSGDIKALSNTRITIRFEANNPVDSAKAVFESGGVSNFARLGRTSGETSFVVTRNDRYRIRLVDLLGNESPPVQKSIEVTPDMPPEVRIDYPGRDTVLTQNMLLPLTLAAQDDFGLRDLALHYQVNDEPEKTLPVLERIPSAVFETDWVFDLRAFSLIPGDRVTYWAEVTDNSPQGQKATSRRYVARFPSIEEIYKEIEEQEQDKHEELSENLEKSKDLNKDFEEKRREMMKKDQYDWQDKKDLEKLLERQDKLSDQVQKLTDDYQNLIDKVKQNEALSQETLQKMEKIRELMQEISSEDLQQAMDKLRQSMDRMDPDVMKKAMENMKFSMDDYMKKLDRTIDLLEQIKKEQSLQKTLEIGSEMQRMQEQLYKKTESSKDTQSLANEQRKIADKLDAMRQQLDQTEQMLQPGKDDQVRQMMDELRQQMEKDNLAGDMQQSEQNLGQNQKQQSMQNQQSALQKMQGMNASLQKMQQSMSSGSSGEVMEAFREATRRMLAFSELHERSAARYVKDPFVILNEQLANFEGVQLVIQQLFSTPMAALYLSPKFMIDAQFTNATYRQLFSDINDTKYFQVPKYLGDIQKGLNLMTYDLMQSAKNMQSGGAGSGMQTMMQMLQQMSGEQLAMNMLTQQLMQQMQQQGGGMSQDQRSQLERIAGSEEQLAENLRRMLQNDPEAQKQGGSLGKTADELDAIAKQIRQNRIDQSLVDRQEKILSRLLDAQKSIHQREFSRERKAERSDREDWETPEETRQKFEEMRKKALLSPEIREYPKEYQDLIKEYMKRLNAGKS
jgi:hypothetical protein